MYDGELLYYFHKFKCFDVQKLIFDLNCYKLGTEIHHFKIGRHFLKASEILSSCERRKFDLIVN